MIAIPLISILRTVSVNPTTTDLVFVDEDGTVNEIGNNKIDRAKVDTKIAKSKS